MRWRLRLAEYRFATEYKKGIKNCIGDAISRIGSTNHAFVDAYDDLPSCSTDTGAEHQQTAFDAESCQPAVNDVESLSLDKWAHDEPDPLDTMLAVQNDIPEVAEPLLNEEMLHEQETDGFCNYIRSLIESSATSAYAEEVDTGLLLRNLHRPRQIFLPKSLRSRVSNLSHQPILAGHPGARKMYMTMRQIFTDLAWRRHSTHICGSSQCARGSSSSSVGTQRRYNYFRLLRPWRRLR